MANNVSLINSPAKAGKNATAIVAAAGDVSTLARRVGGQFSNGDFGAAGGVNDSWTEANDLLMSAAVAAAGKIPPEIASNPVLSAFHKFKVRLHVASVQAMEKNNRAERVRLQVRNIWCLLNCE